jgi:hypothetical protein
MDRREKLLEGLDLGKSVGAEIGPFCSPIVTRDQGQTARLVASDRDSVKRSHLFAAPQSFCIVIAWH